MNLEYWREYNIFDKLVTWLANYKKELWLPDQSALNKVLEGKTIYLNYTYNFQERWTRDLEGSDMHFSKWDEISKIGEDPIIVHYCDAEKPWFLESKHKFKDDFLLYAKLHDFIGFKPIKRYSCVYRLAEQLDKIGLKLRYWAEMLQKKEVKKLKIKFC